jgi:ribosomal-protein-alanine N-acetyltransferase
VLVEPDGSIVGRVNLFDVREDGSAELGYRIAEKAVGKGHATAAVRQVIELAKAYGLTELRAGTSVDNAASRAVLARAGFTPTGETTFLLRLAVDPG